MFDLFMGLMSYTVIVGGIVLGLYIHDNLGHW